MKSTIIFNRKIRDAGFNQVYGRHPVGKRGWRYPFKDLRCNLGHWSIDGDDIRTLTGRGSTLCLPGERQKVHTHLALLKFPNH